MIETLGDIIRNNAYKFPSETALIHGDLRRDFRTMHDRAARLASALHGLGLRRQDRVSIYAMNCAEFLDVYGAAELAGFIATTVNFRLAPPEIAYIVKDSQPKILIFEAQYADVVDALRPALPFVQHFVCIGTAPAWALDFETLLQSGSPEGPPIRARADDIMHLIYTSGTTGRPKGVIRRHHAEVEVADLMATEIGVIVSDRMQLMMPLFHVGSRFLQLGAHLRGATVILHRAFDAADVLHTIDRERATITHMAPTLVQAVLDVPGIEAMNLSSLHTVCYSAAPMSVALLRRGLKVLGPVFLQLYGMTEGGGTTLHKRQHNPDGTAEEIKRLGSIGQAAPNVDVRIADEHGQPLPTGEVGEILTRTGTHMSGYWNNTAATLDALRDGWYHTGDVGYLDTEGFLYLVDRKKDMIISGAENIYSREVEEAIASHPAVADCAVIGVPDAYWGETVRGIVVLTRGMTATAEDVIAHCRTQIAGYKRPRSIVFIDDLPRLPSGKINKVTLRELYRQG